MRLRGLLLTWLLAGCVATPSPPPAATTLPTQTPFPPAAANSTPTPIAEEITTPPAAPPAPALRTRYQLQAVLDYAVHRLDVDQQIEYTNNTTQALEEIWLVVEAPRQLAGVELLHLQSTTGPALSTSEHSIEAGLLRLPLAAALSPGETLSLALEYRLYLPQGAGMLSWAERQTNFIDWYPYVPPYIQGRGWVTHPPAAVGEHGIYESADFDVHLRVVNGPPTLSVAAPAPAVPEDDGWRYRLENARRFVWSASAHYLRLQTRQGDIPISIYYYEGLRDAAQAALLAAADALRVYEDLFGPYPYQSATIVIAGFPDGMESDGLFFLDIHYFRRYSYDRRNYLTMLTVHEITHNWWFGQVGSDQALEPWLDESLSIYAELLYYEAVQPNLVDWWWEFRIGRFAPSGNVDSRIYDHEGFSSYVGAVYMRGAQFLHALRSQTGDEAFFAFLRDYAEQGRGRIMSQDDFFAILAQHSDTDIRGLLAEYFED
ncbi:MAG: hypothetical protein KIS80_03630 [Anaerolineales bacterium]|nr:hypothetical protein [Anaerolineales bacterium]